MKKIVLLGSITLLIGSLSYAEMGPCKNIKSACESAGFTKGGHKEGKGLHMDCMKLILEGQSVAGVSVDPAIVTACKEKKAKRMEKPPVSAPVK